MNKEIEEILDFFKEPFSKEKTHKAIDKEDTKVLLDYITKLQADNEYLNKCNIELARRNDKAIDFISFICFNSERPLTINECNKLYAILKGSDKE